MTWELFYLICFLVGFLLSLVSFLAGAVHLHIPARMHLHVGHSGSGHGVARGGGGRASISPFNFATLTAFLAWFGAAGYLLTRYSTLWLWTALVVSVVTGVAGGAAVFWFLGRLLAHEKDLDPADYEMTGVLGRVTSSIREGGTGEIVFSQEGVRHCAGARSESGEALKKGTEVVVTRYEKGIAYVRRWDELVEEHAQARTSGS